MAIIQDLKFLSLDGLKVVIKNIKDIITAEAAKAPINTFSATHSDTDATLTVKQAGYDAKTLTINAAGETAGLMSKADKAKLDGIASGAQVNVIEGIVVRAEGDTDSAIAMTTLIDGKKLVIDNLGAISTSTPTESTAALKDKKLAPTAKAVRDYVTSVQTSLGGDISGLTTRMSQAEADIDQLEKDLAAEKTARENADTGLQNAINDINNATSGILATAKAYTDTEVTKENQRALGVEAGLQDAINDINNATSGILATAKTYANGLVDTEKAARENADNGIIADLDKVEAFLGALTENNSKAENVYNKTEANKAINDAVAALEAKLLGADRDEINDAYETLKGIADWISEDKTGAAALTARVEQNEKDIEALENKDIEILNTIGAGYSATNTIAAAITAIQNNLTAEVTRSTEKDAELNTAITNEASRADAAEKKIAGDLAKEVTDREAADKTLQDNIDALGLTVSANNNAVNKKIDELNYVSLINNLACDDSGNLTVTYAVNDDTDKTISFGSLIQETEINALFV
jgi:hypothetical protein